MYKNKLIDIREVSHLESVRSKQKIIQAGEKLNKIAFIEKGVFQVRLKIENEQKLALFNLDSGKNNLIVFPQQLENQPLDFEVEAIIEGSVRWMTLLKYNQLTDESELMRLKLYETLEYCNNKLMETVISLKKKEYIRKSTSYI